MSENVFILGTGRCGSTLLSNMLNLHPQVLSLSEFFTFVTDLGTLISEAFPEHPLDGRQFWQFISACHAKQNTMLRHDIAMREVLYPWQTGQRFNAQNGVPALLQTTLPHLDPQCDALFDELAQQVCSYPMATAAQHYQALFDWLTKRYGKSLWVERSGGSLRVANRLIENFPQAKFVHLVRNGEDCALSMQRHNGFKMALLIFQMIEVLGIDPFESDDRSWQSDLPDDLVPFLPENFDGQAFRDYEISPSLYGYYWSGEIIEGLAALERLPKERCHTLRYEDILQSPRETLAALMQFIGPDLLSEEWLAQAMAMIGTPSSCSQQLCAKEQALLSDACQSGFAALQERGIGW